MNIDPTPSRLDGLTTPVNHLSSPLGRALTSEARVPTLIEAYADRTLEDLAYVMVSIAETLVFDEWSAVVVARVVEHGIFDEPEDSESLAEGVRCALSEASYEVDVKDHQQFSEFLDTADWYGFGEFEDAVLPEKGWTLINRLREMSDFERLALVRKVQQTFGTAMEENLSLVEALRYVGLVRP